jgi:hypothetical protein
MCGSQKESKYHTNVKEVYIPSLRTATTLKAKAHYTKDCKILKCNKTSKKQFYDRL